MKNERNKESLKAEDEKPDQIFELSPDGTTQ